MAWFEYCLSKTERPSYAYDLVLASACVMSTCVVWCAVVWCGVVWCVGYENSIHRRLDNFIIGLTDVDSSTSPPQRNNYPMCATWSGSVKMGSKVELKCNANLPKYRYLIAQASASAPNGKFTICELEAYESLNENSSKWNRQSNMALAGFQFKQLNVRSVLDCMHKCKQLGGCDSINFHPASKLCQLNSHINGYNITTLTSDTNWLFYTTNFSDKY
ncbi:hypothetical protein HELRODRAFT_175358 [Helobdella robusta]|uniref:Apple domain-containing protein n=1 Tax=Helobdella robusta TaxID=6412 RepID=T1F969_HELRO|nr:hypothetical protein HELRODRAFT_175358 [Helobdella robusta]ESO00863.1 hypothetical protein HELRODRAFT_175358 [Helobdella robusta]